MNKNILFLVLISNNNAFWMILCFTSTIVGIRIILIRIFYGKNGIILLIHKQNIQKINVQIIRIQNA